MGKKKMEPRKETMHEREWQMIRPHDVHYAKNMVARFLISKTKIDEYEAFDIINGATPSIVERTKRIDKPPTKGYTPIPDFFADPFSMRDVAVRSWIRAGAPMRKWLGINSWTTSTGSTAVFGDSLEDAVSRSSFKLPLTDLMDDVTSELAKFDKLLAKDMSRTSLSNLPKTGSAIVDQGYQKKESTPAKRKDLKILVKCTPGEKSICNCDPDTTWVEGRFYSGLPKCTANLKKLERITANHLEKSSMHNLNGTIINKIIVKSGNVQNLNGILDIEGIKSIQINSDEKMDVGPFPKSFSSSLVDMELRSKKGIDMHPFLDAKNFRSLKIGSFSTAGTNIAHILQLGNIPNVTKIKIRQAKNPERTMDMTGIDFYGKLKELEIRGANMMDRNGDLLKLLNLKSIEADVSSIGKDGIPMEEMQQLQKNGVYTRLW